MQIPKTIKMLPPHEQDLSGTMDKPIDDQFLDTIISTGLTAPTSIIPDGEIHRFYASGQKKHKLNGWYVLSPAKHCGAFGDWATDTKVFFTEHFSKPLTPFERAQIDRNRAELEKKEREARTKRQAEVAEESRQVWEFLPPADPKHPYLVSKGIKASFGLRQADQNLVVPVHDEKGLITSLQYISPKGNKHFKTAGRIKGCFWWIGESEPAFMAEGMATAAAIYQETGKTCLVAFNADNLIAVAKHYPQVTIVADNDESGKGEECARKAGNPFIVVPRLKAGDTDADDYMLSGGNLCELLGVNKERKVFRTLKDVSSSPVPQRWLVRNIVPQGASLGMLFGKSGSTKSYLAISLMLSVATGQPLWFEKKVKPGKVLYLCGEGHHAAYERMACWLQQNNVTEVPDTMFIAEDTFNLDTPLGETEFLAALEKELSDFSPDLVVVDTLNLYMASDENSTLESTMFIKALRRLASRFDCSILLIHHTGVAEQDRARGSSVFLGAMDYQLKVSKTESGDYKLEHTKNKAGIEEQPMFYHLETHEVEGWFDEDGNTVTNAIPVQIEEESVSKIERKNRHEDENSLISAMGRFGRYTELLGFHISRTDFTDYFRSLMDNPESKFCHDRTNPNPAPAKRNRSVAWRLIQDGSIEYEETGNMFYVTGPEMIEKIRCSMACKMHFKMLDETSRPVAQSQGD